MVYLVDVEPFDRTYGPTVLLFDSYYDISSAYVIEIVGECANRAVYGFGVPSLFELDTVTLYGSAAQKLFDVDRQLVEYGCVFMVSQKY